MTVSFVAMGAMSASSSETHPYTINPTPPAGTLAGDKLIAFVAWKIAQATSINTPDGWTKICQGASTSGQAPGSDSGDTTIALFERIYDGTGYDAPVFTLTGGNTGVSGNNLIGQIGSYRSGTGVWGTTQADVYGWPTNVSPVTTTHDISCVATSLLVGTFSANTDSFSVSSIVPSQSGVTFGAMTKSAKIFSTNGSDVGIESWRIPVSTGEGDAPLTTTLTLSAARIGALAVAHLTDIADPGGLVYVETAPGVWTSCEVRTHDGSDWVARDVQVHDGSSWVPVGAPA